jgi:4a-hydroxytetrahydrobiopterin dehydratase
MNHVIMWQEQNNSLSKEFYFTNFDTALEFVNQVGAVAEQLGHHPDIHLSWGKVVIITTTHDSGNTITPKDTMLCQIIDSIHRE